MINNKKYIENTKYPFFQIAEYYHVSTSSIKHINVGRNHYDDSLSYPIRKFKGKNNHNL